MAGKASVEELIEICQKRGYDFFALHDLITDIRIADKTQAKLIKGETLKAVGEFIENKYPFCAEIMRPEIESFKRGEMP